MEIDPFIFRLSIFILSIFYWLLRCLECYSFTTYSIDVSNQCHFICNYSWCGNCSTSHNFRGAGFSSSSIFGYLAIILAAVNIFGGFLVTQRMLQMYKKKKDKK